MTVTGDEAEALETLVLAFEKRAKAEGFEDHERDRMATLALNLRSLSNLIDQKYALGFRSGRRIYP